MTTTTVRKGTGRAAAKAKTEKAAQKPTTTATTKPVTTEKAQLIEQAAKLGIQLSPRATKADLIEAIRKATEVEPAREAPAAKQPKDNGGKAKLARLTAALEPFGWKVTVKTTGDRIEATAQRGQETLRQVWANGGYDYDASAYTNGEASRKVRNLSEAIRLCAVKAE